LGEPSWFEKIYIDTKQSAKNGYHKYKEKTKYVLDTIGFGENTDLYKACAKVSNVTEPIFSGIVETAEFVYKNADETGDVLSDLTAWAMGGDTLDKSRLMNYLYNYYEETDGNIRELLEALPPQSLSEVLKYANKTLSDMKKIPTSQISMDIALSDPKNIKEAEYWTSDTDKIDDFLATYKDELTQRTLKHLERDLPLIEFKADSQHAKLLQDNDLLQEALKEWASIPEDKRVNCFGIELGPGSDVENGVDTYATFNEVVVLNPQVDKDGNITAYVYDIYDIAPETPRDQKFSLAISMAYHLQESGHLQNYRMLIPIKIPAEKVQQTS